MAHEKDCLIHNPLSDEVYGCNCKTLSEYSSAEIRAELARRRNDRRKIHRNARTNEKIRALEKEIENLKKELE